MVQARQFGVLHDQVKDQAGGDGQTSGEGPKGFVRPQGFELAGHPAHDLFVEVLREGWFGESDEGLMKTPIVLQLFARVGARSQMGLDLFGLGGRKRPFGVKGEKRMYFFAVFHETSFTTETQRHREKAVPFGEKTFLEKKNFFSVSPCLRVSVVNRFS
jgi:hypothetical protein